MYCQLTVAFVSPCVLASIDPAPLLDQPRPECCDFHRSLLLLTSAINLDSLRGAKFRVNKKSGHRISFLKVVYAV
jgi:hypothetical protein